MIDWFELDHEDAETVCDPTPDDCDDEYADADNPPLPVLQNGVPEVVYCVGYVL